MEKSTKIAYYYSQVKFSQWGEDYTRLRETLTVKGEITNEILLLQNWFVSPAIFK